jgi:hypothetical protein
LNVISAFKLPDKFESEEAEVAMVAEVAERPATYVISSEKKASLSAEFYTRTTPEQEELIQFPNSGVLVIMGVAGSGKTSVALGRVKKLRDSSYSDFDDESYDDFFKETHRMVGFVLHKQLVPYLKETCSSTGLELSSMPVKEYKELQQEILAKYQNVLQLQMTAASKGKYKRTGQSFVFPEQTKMTWLRKVDKEVAVSILDEIKADIQKTSAEFIDFELPERIRGSQAVLLKSLIQEAWQSFSQKALEELQKRKLKKGKWDFSSIELVNDLNGLFNSWYSLFDNHRPFYENNGKISQTSSGPLQKQIFPFNTARVDSETAKSLNALRQQLREKVRSSFKLSSKGSQLRLTDTYLCALRQLSIDDDTGLNGVHGCIDMLESGRLTNVDLDTLIALTTLITWKATDESIPFNLQEHYKYTSVFIDEVQDFSEVQVFNMGLQAEPKRHAITAVGDFRQQLYADTVSDLTSCFPMMTRQEPEVLTVNKRQVKVLARYSQYIRDLIEGKSVNEDEINWDSTELQRLHVNENDVIDAIKEQLQNIGQDKSVAVICPSHEIAEQLEKCLSDSILENFRESHVAQNSNELNKPYYIHFTTPKPTKGLEFDVVLMPYSNKLNVDDRIEANHLYVAVSRPREQLCMINVR